MNIQNNKEFTYFQYYKDLNIPIYLKLAIIDFEQGLPDFLNEICFTQLSTSDNKKIEEEIITNPDARVLKFTEATPTIAHNIHFYHEGDSYGPESVTMNDSYRIYRYKGVAVQVFSTSSKEWELGCFTDFGDENERSAYSIIINRFLSWAIISRGVIGFWGVPVDEGVVILKQKDANGEAVFFDMYKNIVYTLDGLKKLNANFVIMKLDRTLRGRNIKMTSGELLSFLNVHCCYFDFNGLSVPARQLIRTLSMKIKGLIHPQENFKPRTDLSV